jgi:hypothetical protein
MGKRCFTQPRGAVEQNVIQRFSSALGSGDGDSQVFLDPGLSDEVIEAPRSEAGIKRYIFGTRFARNNAVYSASPPNFM